MTAIAATLLRARFLDVMRIADLERILKAGTPPSELNTVHIGLYSEALPRANAEALTEAILMTFRDSQRAYKRTYLSRFSEFDQLIIDILRDTRSGRGSASLQVHDHAVSDGRTSVEFFHQHRSEWESLTFHASDYSAYVVVVSQGARKWSFTARDGACIDAVNPPFVHSFTWAHLGRRHAAGLLLEPRRLRSCLRSGAHARRARRAHSTGSNPGKELILFHPRALALAAEDDRFILHEEDLKHPSAPMESLDLVRAMNVLNPSNFTRDAVRGVVRRLLGFVREGGVFATGSNPGPGSTVDGGLYRRSEDRFVLAQGSGRGSLFDEDIRSTHLAH
jgi:hypothetical protein